MGSRSLPQWEVDCGNVLIRVQFGSLRFNFLLRLHLNEFIKICICIEEEEKDEEEEEEEEEE